MITLAIAGLATMLSVGSSALLAAEQAREDAAREALRSDTLTIFFVSDGHSRHPLLERFIEYARKHSPDLILDAGDAVHDGTEPEFRRAMQDREHLQIPWYTVRGNHDAQLRGPFTDPPPVFPPYFAVNHGDLRILMLDNHDEELSEAQFSWLEDQLAEDTDRRIVVIMHVPPLLRREPWLFRARHLLPFPLASPVMRVPEQVRRFTDLVEGHGVLMVLTGHTHFADRFQRGGVHYVIGGALGGLTPGLNVPNEFKTITVVGREIEVERRMILRPAYDPVTYLARAFQFYRALNGFNRSELGWNYVPSASVHLRSGLRRRIGDDGAEVTVLALSSFERVLGAAGRRSFVADVGAGVGPGEAVGVVAVGARFRPVGDFNRNVFVSAGLIAQGGAVGGVPAGSVGFQAGAGLEWGPFTLELTSERATLHPSSALLLGRRF
jgi:predicted phosphodiesterase